jgi:N-acylneuraminate cytidylyltransferase
VFLQCTSPLRSGDDIDQAILQFRHDNADSLVSVSPTHKFIWEYSEGMAKSINYDYRHRPRRQEMPPQYVENGSIYIFKPLILEQFNNRLGGKVSLFVMREHCIDIDEILDFEIADLILSRDSLSKCASRTLT